VSENDGVLARERVILVRCGDELFARQFACRLCNGGVKAFRRIEPRTDGSAAEGKFVEEGECRLQLFL